METSFYFLYSGDVFEQHIHLPPFIINHLFIHNLYNYNSIAIVCKWLITNTNIYKDIILMDYKSLFYDEHIYSVQQTVPICIFLLKSEIYVFYLKDIFAAGISCCSTTCMVAIRYHVEYNTKTILLYMWIKMWQLWTDSLYIILGLVLIEYKIY